MEARKLFLCFAYLQHVFWVLVSRRPSSGAPPPSINGIPGKKGETDYGNRLLTVSRTELNTFQRASVACLLTVYGRDRKSTRLNSSHGSISYAVFCLK